MDRNMALEMVRVTEAAALSCAHWMGRGDTDAADHAAVESMRERFNELDFAGRVVIGEGERDEAPMLFIGEQVGRGTGPAVDLALDPLECTNSVAFGRPNAMSVVALGPKGSFLHAPDTYMEKLAVGHQAREAIDLSKSIETNLGQIHEALQLKLEELTVAILERPRHDDLVRRIRKLGARIRLIPDGDVSAAIATSMPDTGVDVLVGIGGAPEGVLAAAALRCLGGAIQGRLKFRNPEERQRAVRMGVQDPDRIYRAEELATGEELMFSATGVTDGELLDGVRFSRNGASTHSVVMRLKTRTVRFIKTHHHYHGGPE
ncbi:MAG: class II fructose-bisphosphatase [candidate division Zixibacteria bacterium]|nr:class II fructose-bisphosphatase [candidate division Zixibacteria bacterium]